MLFLLGLSFLGLLMGMIALTMSFDGLYVGLSLPRSTESVLIIQTGASLSPKVERLATIAFSKVINSFPLMRFIHLYLAYGGGRTGVRQGRQSIKDSWA